MAERGVTKAERELFAYTADRFAEWMNHPEAKIGLYPLVGVRRVAAKRLAAELRARAQGPKAKKPFGKKGKH